MNAHITNLVISALLLSGALAAFPAHAATATAMVSAEIISPAEVAIIAAEELHKWADSGVFTLRIASASGTISKRGDEEMRVMTLSSIWTQGNKIVMSTTDSPPQALRILALASSHNIFGMNGILSNGQGVNLFVTHAEEINGKGTVYAIIAYN